MYRVQFVQFPLSNDQRNRSTATISVLSTDDLLIYSNTQPRIVYTLSRRNARSSVYLCPILRLCRVRVAKRGRHIEGCRSVRWIGGRSSIVLPSSRKKVVYSLRTYVGQLPRNILASSKLLGKLLRWRNRSPSPSIEQARLTEFFLARKLSDRTNCFTLLRRNSIGVQEDV